MIQIAYVSSTRGLLTVEELSALLVRSREKNRRCGITGMLLYRDGNVLQIIEGEPAEVTALFETIRKDTRHAGVIKLYQKTITERDFPSWMMGFRDLGAGGVRELEGFSDVLDPQFDMMKINPSDAAKLLRAFKTMNR